MSNCGEKESKKLPIVIMAGGFGKRAARIDSTVPKPMIMIAGKPILQWEIECAVTQGFKDIIITVSHMRTKIIDYFGDGSRFGCRIRYYVEEQPLGNAGALFKLKQSGELKSNSDFLLLNADSMLDISFDRFVSFHYSRNAQISLFVHPNNHPYDSGLIISNEDGRVLSWLSREDPRPEYYKNRVNAGIHILNTAVLEKVGINPEMVGAIDNEGKIIKVDLDRQILKPMCSGSGKVFAYYSPEYVKDMGTPDRFNQVENDLRLGIVYKKNLSRPQRAIFLDRDGTINKYLGYIKDTNDFVLIDGVAEAIRLINNSGYLCIVVTNQPVIARGELAWSDLNIIHNKMETLLGKRGAYIDDIYICPHHPDKGFEGEVPELKIDCDCRKPKPGLLIKAGQDYNINLKESWMIGDSWRDEEAGMAAGCKTLLIDDKTDLLSAVKRIMMRETNETL